MIRHHFVVGSLPVGGIARIVSARPVGAGGVGGRRRCGGGAVAVGVVILFQVLSTEVSNRLREYATMKALGFGNGFLYRIGVVQALLFAVMGFVPALVFSWGVYALVRALSQLTPGLVGVVLALSLAMCVVSCVMALGKVRRADPAELF
ncbi:MAG: hypothetical protein J6386_16850 [Candidatus Synoicihabitans palmerolidicus]|nr:hypothetical protein [Candidatus Synoicihabitans palmerolidicus]